jgi:predicted lipoprotein with Yx(FWY)xxD motif
MRAMKKRIRIPILIGAIVAICLSADAALAQTKTPDSADTTKGKALVDINGMTLYVFDRDRGGKSHCNGQCAINWQPLIADTDAQASGSFSFITRDDGRKQWAYRGKPLYTWIKDKHPGDATGEGVNNVWHVAAP